MIRGFQSHYVDYPFPLLVKELEAFPYKWRTFARPLCPTGRTKFGNTSQSGSNSDIPEDTLISFLPP